MEITLNQTLCMKAPLKFGIIEYHNITVSESPMMLKGRLQLFQESIYFDVDTKPLEQRSGISEWRNLFKTIGTNPSRYRPSVEAMYRRIYKQNYLNTVHSAVDLNNFFSLQYETPIGLYDLEKINHSVTIEIGTKNDTFIGLNRRENSLENMIITKDKLGAFGSPFVDSERTAVNTDTTHALQIVYLPPSISNDRGKQLTHSLEKMFTNIHGGNSHSYLLSCEGCE
ncbi:phenylalanine--tRNA ligase beta subunit-related protein [Bacillus spongiae]|uniref:Phenylalanine--tRNA ligase beta subunit-related protein n=1 Tax=Bacillus spongiae TaxID=2683610 RepID=A0ABU8HAE2_9BACI